MDSYFLFRELKFVLFVTLILFFGLIFDVQTAQAVSSQKDVRLKEENSDDLNYCDLNPELKTYDVQDLLRCMGAFAANSLPAFNENSQSIFPDELGRIFETLEPEKEFNYRSHSRQRPDPYGSFDGILNGLPFGLGGLINPATYPYGTGSFGLQGLTGNPDYDPLGTSNPGLVEALTSISQYDDRKCVPRILCEIATGSKPGNGDYKASALENFGKNTLIGLLTAYNFERTLPLLGFVKAALLGYSNKGDASICYQEYFKCPRDPRDLVYYLNNHNGGFFQFFRKTRQAPSRVVQSSNRISYARKEPAPPPGLSGPESDRTGTGELKFDNPEPSARQDEDKSESQMRYDSRSKIVFPKEQENNGDTQQFTGNRVSKSLETTVSSQGFFSPTSNNVLSKSPPSFFPSNDKEIERANIVRFKNEKDSSSNYEKEGKFFNNRASDAESAFIFPDQEKRKVRLNSGILKPFDETRR